MEFNFFLLQFADRFQISDGISNPKMCKIFFLRGGHWGRATFPTRGSPELATSIFLQSWAGAREQKYNYLSYVKALATTSVLVI